MNSELRLRFLLEADAAAARNALEQVQTELRQVGDEAAKARERAVAAGNDMERTNNAVAGSAAQVGYQFNDIAMMWAAGQSPFMTAIQQGTQLNQILGTQGMKGAAETAKAALATMFTPFNAAVVIGLGVAGTIVQKLMEVGAEAKTVEERMTDLAKATKDYKEAADAAEVSIEKLRRKYGEQADEMQRILQADRDIKRQRAETELAGLVEASGFSLDVNVDIDSALAEIEAKSAQLKEAFAAATAINDQDAMASIAAQERQLSFAREAVRKYRTEVDQLARSYQISFEEADRLARATAEMQNSSGAAQVEAADRLLTVMTEVFGTVQAADAATGGMATQLIEVVRQGAEAEAVTARTAANLGIAAAAAEGISAANIAGNIAAALGPAAALAAKLWEAARGAAAAAGLAGSAPAGGSGPSFERGGRSGSSLPPMVQTGPTLDDLIDRYSGSTGGAAGGGGGSPVSAEAAEARRAAEELRRAAQEAAREIEAAREELMDSLRSGFTEPFTDFITGTASAKDAFADFTSFLERKVAELIAKQIFDGLFQPLLDPLVGIMSGGGGAIGGGGGGGLLGFLGSIFGGLFATGGAPLSAMANTIVARPTAFAMGGGKTGILGEDGDEAIMPLRGKGALAILPGGQEARLPLARGIGGDLGVVLPPDLIAAVQPFANGGAPGRALASLAAELPGPRSTPSAAPMGGGGGAAPKVNVTVNNNGGEPMEAKAEVKEDGEGWSIEVMVDQLDNAFARRIMGRRGATHGAMQTAFGLGRPGR